jgi:hypothetical protein
MKGKSESLFVAIVTRVALVLVSPAEISYLRFQLTCSRENF